MRPREGDSRRRRQAEPQKLPRNRGLIPDLFREKANADRELLVRLQQRERITAGGELVMGAFTREQRPGLADTPAAKRRSVGSLAVSVVVVAVPARTCRHIDLQDRIDDPERIEN